MKSAQVCSDVDVDWKHTGWDNCFSEVGGSWVGGDLVGDDDGKVEDLGEVLHLCEDLAHPLLPLGELPAAGELLLGERERGACEREAVCAMRPRFVTCR